MVQRSLAPKWPLLVHFCGMDHQKSNFLLILAPLLSEAVEDRRGYFFQNWFMKLKIYYLLKPLGTITQQNCWFFYLSELIYFAIFTMRHPVAVSSQTNRLYEKILNKRASKVEWHIMRHQCQELINNLKRCLIMEKLKIQNSTNHLEHYLETRTQLLRFKKRLNGSFTTK